MAENTLVSLRLPSQPSMDVAPGASSAVRTRGHLYLETFGCQMNVSDSDLIVGLLAREGYAPTERPQEADLILLNTCAVREKAEEKVFARIAELRGHKKKRNVLLGVVGCMAEHLKETLLERAPDVDLIAGPDAYRRLPDLVRHAGQAGTDFDPLVDVRLDRAETYEGLSSAQGDGTSGLVTIQRGCDKFCTFCVVPLTRGRERGTPPQEVLHQVRTFADAGYKEVTLLGQTVNSYRFEDVTFADLLRAVARISGIERVRFTSPYPIDFTEDVIEVMATDPKVCKHVHLPLQSGSERVLERMKRGYSYRDFLGLVHALRGAMPTVALTTDIIVGFCGETEADHARTLSAMEEIRFDGAFQFAYSERSGTGAHRKIPDDVPIEVKKRRLGEVIALQERHSLAAHQRLVGKVERVLLAGRSKRRQDELIGRTDGFKAVIVPRGDRTPGDLVDVRIERASSATLVGVPV